MAESGTGVASEVEEFEELEEPEFEESEELLPEFVLDEESAVLGVVDESVLEFDDERPALVEAAVVVLPLVLDSALIGEDELRPALEDGLSVLTAPLEAEDVRPEVLCAVEPELELLVP